MLTQKHYVKKLLKKIGHHQCQSNEYSLWCYIQLIKNKGNNTDQSRYAQIIGSLMHLMNFTRPNIAYAYLA